MRMPIVIFIPILSLSLLAQHSVMAQPVQPQLPDNSVQLPAAAAPLFASPTTQDRAGRIVVPVLINGLGPFRFVVDTGANTSVLSPRLANHLGLVPSGQTEIAVSGVTGRTIVGTVPIAKLEVGELKMIDLHLPVIGSALAGVDGILGVDGFEDMRLTVDFAHDSVKIERSDNKRASREFTVMPARFRHGRLLTVETKVGAVPAKAVIDTGAEGTLGNEALRQAMYRRLVKKSSREQASVEGVTADIQYGDIVRAAKILFEGVEIEGIDIAYGEFHVFNLWEMRDQPALLVGMDVLGTAEVLVIDYRRRELRIKPRSNILHPIMR